MQEGKGVSKDNWSNILLKFIQGKQFSECINFIIIISNQGWFDLKAEEITTIPYAYEHKVKTK